MHATAYAGPRVYLLSLWQWRLIVGYVPLYLLGFVLARAPRFRERMIEGAGGPLAVLLFMACVYTIWFQLVAPVVGGEQVGWNDVIPLVGESLCPITASLLILKSAMAVKRLPTLVLRLSDASFTIYIVHFPLILLISQGFARVGWNPYLEFSIAVIGGGTLSYTLHAVLIRRSSAISLLLNGRRLSSSSSAEPSIQVVEGAG